MRIITFNLNGIRSAAKKGFFNWLEKQNADVVCLQETKAQLEKLEGEIFRPDNYYHYFSDAQKPGYSGVGIYCRQKPDNVSYHWGWAVSDQEGRYVQVDFGPLTIISLYMPSGTSGEERQAIKWQFMRHFLEYLKKIRESNRHYIICGDWNIAHKTIDLKNWKANQKHSGFLPDERAWLDRVLNEHEWVDAFRELNKNAEQYTWWSHRGRAREKNVGWRIDYQITTPELKNKIKVVSIYTDQNFSDHAPLIIDYAYNL